MHITIMGGHVRGIGHTRHITCDSHSHSVNRFPMNCSSYWILIKILKYIFWCHAPTPQYIISKLCFPIFCPCRRSPIACTGIQYLKMLGDLLSGKTIGMKNKRHSVIHGCGTCQSRRNILIIIVLQSDSLYSIYNYHDQNNSVWFLQEKTIGHWTFHSEKALVT